MAASLDEVYVKIALEDSPKAKTGTVIHSDTNLGEICEKDTRLFAVGTDEVEYNNQVFQKGIDRASVIDGFAVREMWYYSK